MRFCNFSEHGPEFEIIFLTSIRESRLVEIVICEWMNVNDISLRLRWTLTCLRPTGSRTPISLTQVELTCQGQQSGEHTEQCSTSGFSWAFLCLENEFPSSLVLTTQLVYVFLPCACKWKTYPKQGQKTLKHTIPCKLWLHYQTGLRNGFCCHSTWQF